MDRFCVSNQLQWSNQWGGRQIIKFPCLRLALYWPMINHLLKGIRNQIYTCRMLSLSVSNALVFDVTCLTPDVLQNGIHIVYAILLLVIIQNVATKSKSFIRLESSLFSLLGKNSRGIYMCHVVVVFIVVKHCSQWGMGKPPVWLMTLLFP